MLINPRLAKWLKWIEQIKDNTELILVNKAIHERYLDIVKANPEINSVTPFSTWEVI